MKYARIERERRFLLSALPADLDRTGYNDVEDLYLDDTRLRLRKVTAPLAPPVFKLNHKIDEDASHRIVTSLYLNADEYALLTVLGGGRLTKRRYLYLRDGIRFSVDVFGAALEGLMMAEAEMPSDAALDALALPAFAHSEVTHRHEFRGGHLAREPAMSLLIARQLLAAPRPGASRADIPTRRSPPLSRASDDLVIRTLVDTDPPIIARAFRAMGWTKPEAQYVRYLGEQASGARVVLVASLAGEFAGYVTVVWRPDYAPFLADGVPEIQDLNVLEHVRRRGVASALLDAAEALVSARSPIVGIGVGLHPGYNAAQRLYVLRGYVPDARGVAYGNRFVQEGEHVPFDDDLVLRFTKTLARS